MKSTASAISQLPLQTSSMAAPSGDLTFERQHGRIYYSPAQESKGKMMHRTRMVRRSDTHTTIDAGPGARARGL